MTEAEQIALLEQKNKSLATELDKITGELFTAQDTITALQNKIAEKKHTEQLAAWAIDRALEAQKIGTQPDTITASAQSFCEWIKASSAQGDNA